MDKHQNQDILIKFRTHTKFKWKVIWKKSDASLGF